MISKLTGVISILSGDFANGWKFECGKVTKTVKPRDGGGVGIGLKSASSYECTTYYSLTYTLQCYDFYTGTEDNLSYSYSACNEQPVDWEYYEWEECYYTDDTDDTDDTGGSSDCYCYDCCEYYNCNLGHTCNYSGGGGGGGYTPPASDPNLPCSGDPIKWPSITSSGASGQTGGMFGCVRIGASLKCNNEKKYHDGIDIESSVNQNVYSMYGGVVVGKNDSFSPGEYAERSYGNYITIRSTRSDGVSFDIKYNHLNSVDLNIGDTVAVGQIFGKSGNTGNAADPIVRPHVHIQIFENNISIDPCGYFATSFNSNGTVSNPCN